MRPAMTNGLTNSGTDASGDRALTIFAFLWAFATLFHQAAYPADVFQFNTLLVVLPALWVLLEPRSTLRFVILLIAQLVQVWRYGIANVSNHWAFTTFVNLTILLALAWLLLRRRERGLNVERREWFNEFAPVVRLELLILYFFVVFHKLNADFLNPVSSCAAEHYLKFASQLPFVPTAPWALYAAIYGTLIIETAIPVLLCLRRTRVYGIVLAVLFHLMLALNPYHVFYDFSAMLFAAYFLFVPADYWNEMRRLPAGARASEWARTRFSGYRLRSITKVLYFALAAVLIAAYLMRIGPRDASLINLMQEIVRGVWVLYAAGLFAIFLVVARRINVVAPTPGVDDGVLPRRLIAYSVPALLLINGFVPYFGLKTQSSFTMFSNLRTEGDQPNHLFLTGDLKVASFQDDLVRVVESSDPALQRYAKENLLLTYFEFRKITSKAPGASVTFRRGDRLHVVSRIADDPELRRAPSAMLRKFLKFRPVEPPGVLTPCRG